MTTTKDSLIALIKACAQDPEVIEQNKNENYNVNRHNYGFGINKYSYIRKRVDYFHSKNGKNVGLVYQYSIPDSEGFVKSNYNSIKFKALDILNDDTDDNYSISLIFKELPNIYISSYFDTTQENHNIIGKRFGYFNYEMQAVVSTHKIQYQLTCDKYKFEITAEEVLNLVKFILEKREEYYLGRTDERMKSRYQKYKIDVK